jgi:hypothetical protein
LKEGVQIKSSERITITTEETTSVYTLNIHETCVSDQGLYTFVATNKEGESRGDIKLTVKSTVNANQRPNKAHKKSVLSVLTARSFMY